MTSQPTFAQFEEIVGYYDQPDTPRHLTYASYETGAVLPIGLFAVWLAAGERGLSSEAIVQRLTGIKVNTGRDEGAVEPPHDPSDFRRCVELLESVPPARTYLPLMADVSPQWARIVDAWDELENLLSEEEHRTDGKAPRLYRRLKQLATVQDEDMTKPDAAGKEGTHIA